jgi:hypothetical protein
MAVAGGSWQVQNWKQTFASCIFNTVTVCSCCPAITCQALLPDNIQINASTCSSSTGYNTSPTERRYPVLYMHDGQNATDPATSFIGVDWGLDEALVAGVEIGQLQEFISVLVWNTPQRLQEYMPAGVCVCAECNSPSVRGRDQRDNCEQKLNTSAAMTAVRSNHSGSAYLLPG